MFLSHDHFEFSRFFKLLTEHTTFSAGNAFSSSLNKHAPLNIACFQIFQWAFTVRACVRANGCMCFPVAVCEQIFLDHSHSFLLSYDLYYLMVIEDENKRCYILYNGVFQMGTGVHIHNNMLYSNMPG